MSLKDLNSFCISLTSRSAAEAYLMGLARCGVDVKLLQIVEFNDKHYRSLYGPWTGRMLYRVEPVDEQPIRINIPQAFYSNGRCCTEIVKAGRREGEVCGNMLQPNEKTCEQHRALTPPSNP